MTERGENVMIRKVLAEYRQLKTRFFVIQVAEFMVFVGLMCVAFYVGPAIFTAIFLIVNLPAYLGSHITGAPLSGVEGEFIVFWLIGLVVISLPVVALTWVAAFIRTSWKKG
jgi:hypothetical protein